LDPEIIVDRDWGCWSEVEGCEEGVAGGEVDVSTPIISRRYDSKGRAEGLTYLNLQWPTTSASSPPPLTFRHH